MSHDPDSDVIDTMKGRHMFFVKNSGLARFGLIAAGRKANPVDSANSAPSINIPKQVSTVKSLALQSEAFTETGTLALKHINRSTS